MKPLNTFLSLTPAVVIPLSWIPLNSLKPNRTHDKRKFSKSENAQKICSGLS